MIVRAIHCSGPMPSVGRSINTVQAPNGTSHWELLLTYLCIELCSLLIWRHSFDFWSVLSLGLDHGMCLFNYSWTVTQQRKHKYNHFTGMEAEIPRAEAIHDLCPFPFRDVIMAKLSIHKAFAKVTVKEGHSMYVCLQNAARDHFAPVFWFPCTSMIPTAICTLLAPGQCGSKQASGKHPRWSPICILECLRKGLKDKIWIIYILRFPKKTSPQSYISNKKLTVSKDVCCLHSDCTSPFCKAAWASLASWFALPGFWGIRCFTESW